VRLCVRLCVCVCLRPQAEPLTASPPPLCLRHHRLPGHCHIVPAKPSTTHSARRPSHGSSGARVRVRVHLYIALCFATWHCGRQSPSLEQLAVHRSQRPFYESSGACVRVRVHLYIALCFATWHCCRQSPSLAQLAVHRSQRHFHESSGSAFCHQALR
jgi:hypothetical protein